MDQDKKIHYMVHKKIQGKSCLFIMVVCNTLYHFYYIKLVNFENCNLENHLIDIKGGKYYGKKNKEKKVFKEKEEKIREFFNPLS